MYILYFNIPTGFQHSAGNNIHTAVHHTKKKNYTHDKVIVKWPVVKETASIMLSRELGEFGVVVMEMRGPPMRT